MKRLILVVILILVTLATGCGPSTPAQEETQEPAKTISLADAPQILEISSLLPTSFENIDAAGEELSNEDLELGEDFSEVIVYFSEDEPFQMIYHFIGISESRVEAASFDKALEDKQGMESLLIGAIQSGAQEEGIEIESPYISITQPKIGDSAIYGIGYFKTMGFLVGFDTLWFRANKVVYLSYSVYWSEDKVELEPIGREIEKRISEYSQE